MDDLGGLVAQGIEVSHRLVSAGADDRQGAFLAVLVLEGDAVGGHRSSSLE